MRLAFRAKVGGERARFLEEESEARK